MRTWIASLPKSELHVHLEGAIPLPALWSILQRHGGDPDIPNPTALAQRFIYRDFPHFIETWVWKQGFLREEEDFICLAEAAAREWKAQNITYVEAHYTPTDGRHFGLTIAQLTQAMRTGLDRVGGVTVRLICDVVRDTPPAQALRTVDEVADLRTLGIVGIGLGGSEHDYPPEPFAPVFERARARGLRTTAHAGEAAGPQSVRGAVEALRVDRLGHAARAVEDPDLMQLLIRQRIPLELCPISNVRTGAVPSLDRHPVAEYFHLGLPVTINTDDPAMFNTTLEGEFLALHQVHGFTRPDIARLLRNAIDASWMDDTEKARRHGQLDAAVKA